MLSDRDRGTGISLPGKFRATRFFDRRKIAEYKGLKAGASGAQSQLSCGILGIYPKRSGRF